MSSVEAEQVPPQGSKGDASRVIVVGGGLAGMACAAALEGAGRQVTLLEARHALGGRASSFQDPQTGEELDNCQHVLLGCCTNLLDLYRRMGVEGEIRWERAVVFVDGMGRRHALRGIAGMPAPLHMGLSMAGFGLLSLRERLAVSRAMMAMMRLGKAGREKLEGMRFGDWLDAHGQPESLSRKFYEPVLISALNLRCREASAKYAIQVFQDALLAHERGYVVGLPGCPLGQLYGHLPVRDVRLNTRVEEVLFTEGGEKGGERTLRATGVRLRGGETLAAEQVVLATNHHAVQRWLSAAPAELVAHDRRFARLDQLKSMPILGAHLWFDRPVMREAALALVEGDLQWLFKKDAEGRVVHGVISAAEGWSDVPKEEALERFAAQVGRVAACEAKLKRGVIVIEKRATFAPTPGVDEARPSAGPERGGIGGLFLAGDYIKTGWPATMEGAVRGGYAAASAILHPASVGAADLPVQWPARMMGL